MLENHLTINVPTKKLFSIFTIQHGQAIRPTNIYEQGCLAALATERW